MLFKTIKPLLLALTLTTAGAFTPVSAQTARRPSAAPRKVTEGELDRRLDLARSLASEGKFEQSLKEYLFVFDNSRDVTGYAGVRLSYVPGEIADIGRVYRPALVALKTRRDEREKLVLAGKSGAEVVHELRALNEYLGEPERNVALFDKLATMGAAHAETRADLLIMIWRQLVGAKRYGDLKERVDELANRVAGQVAESAVNDDFPTNRVFDTPQYREYLRYSVIEDGGSVYETLLGLGRTEKAEKLAKWMLTLAADGEMYARLINSAVEADRTDVADALVERATKTLKHAEDLRLVREAAQRLRKAN